ncbi:MAG: lactate utilization protein, partial [Tepidisphaeraceae bacterium]
ILQSIRNGLRNAVAAGFGDLREPPVPEVWPRTSTQPAALMPQFRSELQALKGEPIHCPTMADARQQLAQLMSAAPWARLGSLDRPLTRELTAEIPTDRVDWVTSEWTSQQIEQLPVGLITADALLADTGSCVVHCATAQERLMCYLPPACIVVARLDQLAEHLPAAWAPISSTCAAKDSRGEIVLITGPSRTADIEKILILGVHGPKRLVVLVVG